MSGPSGPYPSAVPRLREDSRILDLLFVTVMFLTVGLLSFAVGSAYGGVAAVASVLASIVMPVALYWRRTNPVASAVVVYTAALGHFALGAPVLFTDLLIFVALYSVTAHGPVWAGRLALGGGFIGALLQGSVFAGTSGPGLGGEPIDARLVAANPGTVVYTAGLIGVLCLLAWALGLLRRSRLAHTETLAERARRLEIERDQQAQIATAAERSRIAREMHDVVAHSLSVVIAQADGGRYAAPADPDAAVRALTTISETGRAALSDMRKILGVLRAPADDDASASAITPQPIDADLDTLVEQVRSAGLPCSVVRMGHARPLPPGTGLTVHRICQEALTNVLKHGGPSATATVMLQWGPQQLTIQVDDTGRGAAATSDGLGHGILGMRERVELFAGTIEAGPRPGGGFRVRAVIPLPRQVVPGAEPGGVPLTPTSWPAPTPQEGPQ
ncbi:sensor histidine kinase [Georgenia sp. MJ173]|uniref:sensor histidine kinase n=1 Tax=Georgenia sunbinii TaxID=3117728 RepID=UPI002F26D1CF